VLQLNNHINIIHDCNNVQAVLNNFDVAIHTATSESGPLVLIEYMMMGLPFLTYQTGEVVHQIKNDLPECIIDNFNTIEWIMQLDYLLQQNKNELSAKLKSSFENIIQPKLIIINAWIFIRKVWLYRNRIIFLHSHFI